VRNEKREASENNTKLKKKQTFQEQTLQWNWFFWELLRRSDEYKAFKESYNRSPRSYNAMWIQCIENFGVSIWGKLRDKKDFPTPDFTFRAKDLDPPTIFLPFYPIIAGKPLLGEIAEDITDAHANYINQRKQQKFIDALLMPGIYKVLKNPIPGYIIIALQWGVNPEAAAKEIKKHLEEIQEKVFQPLIMQRQRFKEWLMYLKMWDEINSKIKQGEPEYKAKKDVYDTFDSGKFEIDALGRDTVRRGLNKIKRMINDAGKGKYPLLKMGK
jgi:hypothetical protein